MLSREDSTARTQRSGNFIRWGLCTCWRNQASFGRPGVSRGASVAVTIGYTTWLRFPVRPTVRWHWPRRAATLGELSEGLRHQVRANAVAGRKQTVWSHRPATIARLGSYSSQSRVIRRSDPRRASAMLHVENAATARTALTAAHESSMSGEELRRINGLGIQYIRLFPGSLVAVHTAGTPSPRSRCLEPSRSQQSAPCQPQPCLMLFLVGVRSSSPEATVR